MSCHKAVNNCIHPTWNLTLTRGGDNFSGIRSELLIDTAIHRITLFSVRHNILSQVLKFITKTLKISSSRWSPAGRSSPSTISLKFGSKARLKKLMNLKLSVRRGPWRFWRWLTAYDWLTDAGIEGPEDICFKRAARTGQAVMRTLAGYDEILKKNERFLSCQTSEFNASFLETFFSDSCIATCIVWRRKWWFQMTPCSAWWSAFSFNCHVF
jgi:hypothetical protein